MRFILGVNYWGADWGTEMWRHYDGKKIREEMKQLKEYGVQCMRVFPNWRDFQPIERANACYNRICQYVNANTGEVVEGGIKEQTIRVFENIKAVLAEAGLTLDNVVKTTVFLADISMFVEMNEVYASYFSGTFPARSAFAVKQLPKGALVEIESIAVR